MSAELAKLFAAELAKTVSFAFTVGIGGSPTQPVLYVYAPTKLTPRQRALIPARFQDAVVAIRAGVSARPAQVTGEQDAQSQ